MSKRTQDIKPSIHPVQDTDSVDTLDGESIYKNVALLTSIDRILFSSLFCRDWAKKP